MPMLQATLEEVAGLEPGYLISDHGACWLAGDLLERLEHDTPERLTSPVSWVMPDATERGAMYAGDDTEEVLSAVSLYRVHRLSGTLQPRDSLDLWERHP